MTSLEVEPLLVVGKDDDGIDVAIDVAFMLATNEEIHDATARALRRYFENGGAPPDKIRIRIIITDGENDTAGTAITSTGDDMIDLEAYSPERDEIIARRMGPT